MIQSINVSIYHRLFQTGKSICQSAVSLSHNLQSSLPVEGGQYCFVVFFCLFFLCFFLFVFFLFVFFLCVFFFPKSIGQCSIIFQVFPMCVKIKRTIKRMENVSLFPTHHLLYLCFIMGVH